ncbi:hypothetical protein A3A41_00500 [Candidatus Kaiserbacteria bacterium RIFCSPLOWO2_01_FULL_54_22]|nr:MAG: hypothetical protein A3A41_00500 [Candidatus Kaiserbacteria bacterium RIFCSPLOWO2_01_FULL_54_22]
MALQLAKFLGTNLGFTPRPENHFEKKIHEAWGREPRAVAEAELHTIKWIGDVTRQAALPTGTVLELQGKAGELIWSCAARAYSPFCLTAELRTLMEMYGVAP